MKPSVYIETSIVGYLTSWPSTDPIVSGRQHLTRQWWTTARDRFELYVSKVVASECQKGDAEAAIERMQVIADLPYLDLSPEAEALAAEFLGTKILPAFAADDALHYAIATVNGMVYVATWNLKHLANAQIMVRLQQCCTRLGYRPSQIVTLDFLEELP